MEGVSGERRRVGESESCLLVLKEGVREESLCQALVWKRLLDYPKGQAKGWVYRRGGKEV